MNRDWNGELEDSDEKEEYVEVKKQTEIEAILKAEEK